MESSVHSTPRTKQTSDPEVDDPRIEDLLVLARDKSTASRNQLVETLGGLYYDAQAAVGESERDLMAQIMRDLIHDVKLQVRANLAKRLARDDNPPRELISALANDGIEVAHSILMESNALNDQELIEIVERRTRRHRIAIAMRKAVSEAVSDALVGSGETDVVVTLIKNDGAIISEKTITALVNASENFEAYQSPLLLRSELSPVSPKKCIGGYQPLYANTSPIILKSIPSNSMPKS